jgi:stage II sporulation protein P
MAATSIHVGIYHSHSDESYTPTDGSSSQRGNGSIYEVGAVLANSLRDNGISVFHSTNRHDPHDVNAYFRSRRTVFQLLKQQPDALLDIHRDSAPAASYIASVNGILAAKVMLVIGRQDPHMNVNMAFARELRDETNRLYPGLIKGIFIAHGNYNQDLYPTALLVEIGTETVRRSLADNSAHVLADALAVVLERRAKRT